MMLPQPQERSRGEPVAEHRAPREQAHAIHYCTPLPAGGIPAVTTRAAILVVRCPRHPATPIPLPLQVWQQVQRGDQRFRPAS